MGGTTEAIRTATLLSAKEALFGTALSVASLTDMWVVNTFDPAKVTKTFRTDAGKINGTRGMTQRQIETRAGTLAMPVDLSVELLTWALVMGMGNETVTGVGDPYTHTIKHPAVCTLSPPSTTFLQGIVCSGLTDGYFSYKGCSLESLSITCKGQAAIEMTTTWNHDGSETVQSAASFPTAFETLSYLLGSMTVIKIGPNGGTQTDYSSIVNGYKLTWNFGLKRLTRITNGILVPGWLYSKGNPKLTVEIDIAADKSHTLYAAANAETLMTLEMIWTAADQSGVALTPARSVDMTVDSCYIMADETADDIEPNLNLKFDILDLISNQGPALYACKTGVVSYLNGA